jgi:hypothetical protein
MRERQDGQISWIYLFLRILGNFILHFLNFTQISTDFRSLNRFLEYLVNNQKRKFEKGCTVLGHFWPIVTACSPESCYGGLADSATWAGTHDPAMAKQTGQPGYAGRARQAPGGGCRAPGTGGGAAHGGSLVDAAPCGLHHKQAGRWGSLPGKVRGGRSSPEQRGGIKARMKRRRSETLGRLWLSGDPTTRGGKMEA